MQGPVLVSLAYYAGAEAAFLIGTLSDKIIAPFWPPNAILFCALALLPYRRWPLYVIAVFPAHMIAELGVGMGWSQLIVAFVTNCLVALLSASGLRYLLGAPSWFYSLRSAIIYVLVAAVFAPGIAAFGGAFVWITGGGDFQHYWFFWRQWYVANALGNVTLGVLLLTFLVKDRDWSEFGSRLRRTEATLLVAGLLVACAAAFEASPFAKTCYLPAFLYLPLPIVIWAAVRFRTVGASVAILVVTVASISTLLHGSTVFASTNVEASVLALQLFLMVLSTSSLLLGASVDQLRRTERTAARLARSVLGAQDEERREVARRLLDDICQRAATQVTDRHPATEGSKAVRNRYRPARALLHCTLYADEAGFNRLFALVWIGIPVCRDRRDARSVRARSVASGRGTDDLSRHRGSAGKRQTTFRQRHGLYSH
jgi:integral membrane sensor domain MASE1